MRVTSNTYSNNLVDQLNKLALKQARQQTEVTTGQKIQSLEDDPGTIHHVMLLQTEAASITKYQENTNILKERAAASYNSIKGIKQIIDRAQEIAIASNGLRSTQELRSFAQETTQLIQQVVQFSNAQYRGEYLFAGTKTDQEPFAITTDSEGWVVGSEYRGNSNVPLTEISPGETASAHVPGMNTGNAGPRGLIKEDRTGADVLQHLIDLQNNLRDGKVVNIQEQDVKNLAKDEDNMIFHFAANGSFQSRLEIVSSSLASRSLDIEKSVSNDVDVDLAEAIVKFNQTQSAYQAALQTGASMLNKSLLDYLR